MTTPTSPSTISPTRPYLVRAIYEWINDNALTPYLLINAEEKGVFVPQQYIKDGQIVLNIAPHAVHQLLMDNDAVGFSARFGGVSQQVYVPMRAIMGLYARENGQGLFFDANEYANEAVEDTNTPAEETPTQQTETAPVKKPSLRVLD
ncbi:MAG: ClpXP protease specificity-enhancing factor [Gammaproteobacteria bacterium]|nr:ClpXP protease specificity-enhancing factor [Gammaproteobacteria bacterium]